MLTQPATRLLTVVLTYTTRQAAGPHRSLKLKQTVCASAPVCTSVCALHGRTSWSDVCVCRAQRSSNQAGRQCKWPQTLAACNYVCFRTCQNVWAGFRAMHGRTDSDDSVWICERLQYFNSHPAFQPGRQRMQSQKSKSSSSCLPPAQITWGSSRHQGMIRAR